MKRQRAQQLQPVEADPDLAQLYQAGLLAYVLMQDHQLDDYDEFRTWNVERQSREHLRWVADIGALYDNLWLDECGRRWGKTVKWLIADVEEMLRRPGCRGLIATPLKSSIGGIIVPLTKVLFRGAPEGYFPKYYTSREAEIDCLVIEATDSVCKLIGLDKNPDATRGQFLDFAHITEAVYVKGLHELVTGVLMPQFRQRPWAWLGMESSTAKVPDCDFNRQFREDAKLRGTYRLRTIRDNPYLTDEEIEREERRSGGAKSSTCLRELYCKEVRDEDEMIVPEFAERMHVVDPELWPRPKYALAYVGIDPGTTDPLGLCFAYFDWAKQVLVIEGSWQKANASTGEVVRVIQDFERELWGTAHRNPGDRARELSVAGATLTGNDAVWTPPAGAMTYWEASSHSLRANPHGRISDISNRFILDLNVDHGMNVRAAEKGPGSADADIEHLRTLFQTFTPAGLPRIVILRNGRTENIIEQLRSGSWNTDDTGHRTDWSRSKTLGHCDCLAALKYLARDVNPQRNPNRPGIVDINATSEIHIPQSTREQIQRPASTTFGGRGTRSFARTGSTFR